MKGVLVIFLLLGAVGLSALDLDAAVTEAVGANLGLQAEAKRLSALERDKTWAIQQFFPTLTAGLGWQRWNDTDNQRRFVGLIPQFTGPNVTGLTPLVYNPDPQSVGAMVDLQFTLGLGNFASMDKTLADYDTGRIGYDQAKRRLIHDVKAAFYRILAMRDSLALAQKQLDNAQARLLQVQAGYASGTVPELNLLQARIAVESRKNDRRGADTALGQSLYAFSILLGRSPSRDLVLEGAVLPADPQILDGGALADRLAAGRGDVKSLAAQTRVLDAQTLQVVAMALPRLVVDWTADPGVNDPAHHDLIDPNTWKQTNGALSLQLQWRLDPFLPGGQFWTLSADLADAKDALKKNRSLALDAARAQILGITDRVAQAAASLPGLENNVRDAQRAADLAQVAFAAGVRSLLEVQDADLQAQGAQLALLNERLALQVSWIDLETSLETPLDEILEVAHEAH